MKEILDKIGSYNIFNYLLPGVLFAVFVDHITSMKATQDNLVLGAFVYYFFGSIISRVGSLLLDPPLKRFKFIRFAPYADFIRASKEDQKIETLSEANNMYRTFCSLMLCLGAAKIYDLSAKKWPCLEAISPTVFIVAVFLLYLFSYRKQSQFITKRIEASKT